jgi:hypothetical protein
MSDSIYLTTTGAYTAQMHRDFIANTFLLTHTEKRSRIRDDEGNILPITVTLDDVLNTLDVLEYHDIDCPTEAHANELNNRVLSELWDTEELRDYYTTATIDSVAA